MASLVRPFLLLTLALLGLLLLVLWQAGSLLAFFGENLAVNLMILAVFAFGIGLAFWRLFSLAHEITWLTQIREATPASDADALAAPEVVARLDLMAAFATLWRRFFDSSQILTPDLANTLVESAQARVDERRELSRYLTTALVILGLLGTFWGLLGALVSMRASLEGLDTSQGFFEGLSGSLSQPLRDMGTAFSSSLFGLAASLFFGFVELQTARAHMRFVEDFEIWLTSFVQANDPSVGRSALALTGAPAASSPSAFAASPTGEVSASLESLGQLMRRSQQDTLVVNNNLVSLLDQVTRVADKLGADQTIHEKILAAQADQRILIGKMETLITLTSALHRAEEHDSSQPSLFDHGPDKAESGAGEANFNEDTTEPLLEGTGIVAGAFVAPHSSEPDPSSEKP